MNESLEEFKENVGNTCQMTLIFEDIQGMSSELILDRGEKNDRISCWSGTIWYLCWNAE